MGDAWGVAEGAGDFGLSVGYRFGICRARRALRCQSWQIASCRASRIATRWSSPRRSRALDTEAYFDQRDEVLPLFGDLAGNAVDAIL
jgi:hypothetical protein